MIFILTLSTIEIHLCSNKDTYLLGEDIWIRWEIVNPGESIGYYEKKSAWRILNYNHFRMWDTNGREVPQGGFRIKGVIITTGKDRKHRAPKPTMLEIEPGDTVSSKVVNLIGIFGSLHFESRLIGVGRNYIKPGEYFLSLYYRTKENDFYSKVLSDTLHFFIEEPQGKEKLAWISYKALRTEFKPKGDKLKALKFARYILRRYPESNYAGSVMNHLNSLLGYILLTENEKRAETIIRELLDCIEKNIDKFRDKTFCLRSTQNLTQIITDKRTFSTHRRILTADKRLSVCRTHPQADNHR